LNVLILLLALVIGVVTVFLVKKYFLTDTNNKSNELDQLKEENLHLKNRAEQYANTTASTSKKIEGFIERNAVLEAENRDLKNREIELKNSIKAYANSLISKTMKTLTGDKNAELGSSVDPKQREH